MTTSASSRQHVLLAVFVLSGFAGLIYQSIWSHYLGLFLGHAAYAQALVLALFMGGMAIGAAWIAKAGLRWRNLLRGYALVELVIGCFGLAFHFIFVHVLALGYEVLIPASSSPALASVLKWSMAAILILPQTILLGMTFPLMSGGLIRRYPGQDGVLLGGLYFTNSIGAAVGALVSVFLLLPLVGLPGTSMTAGLVNFVVAGLAWWLAREPETRPAPALIQEDDSPQQGRLLRLVLWGTALSGAASFVYEIVWIRMLAMAVGSTMHAFELMLASFIAGIALGGLWVRKRADKAPDPLRLVGWMQVCMGLAALASLVLYANSFEWVGWLMRALALSTGGYALFNLGTATIAILIMLPAAFFAGTTLPLFTVTLLRAGFGERSIGRVYAWNTMGSILGVFLAFHLLIPMLGLKLALCVGALVDMIIGLLLLRLRVQSRPAMWRFAGAGLVVAVALALAITQVPFDPMRLASGVFRNGVSRLDPSNRVVFYRDGKTASVSVIVTSDGRGSIATNGKVDAGLTVAAGVGPTSDELTMVMAAALPLSLHPNPERIGIVGFGSGLTTHTSLGDPRVQRVDTIEIEAAMVQGAGSFAPRVYRAYTDPRSHIVIDDAKVYFASQKGDYDIIISEPSNPWVSGVGSLFSKEFYQFIPRQLKADGLFVQWVQLYEIDNRLVSSVLNALTPTFGDYAAWLSNGVDLIIIATPAQKLPPIDYTRVLSGVLGEELGYLGIERPEQLDFHKVADARTLRALGRLYGGVANSDYHPVLSLEAPRTRFMRRAASMFTGLPGLEQPTLEMLGIRASLPMDAVLAQSDLFSGEYVTVKARQRLAFLTGADSSPGLGADERAKLAQLLVLAGQCPASGPMLGDLVTRLDHVAATTVPYLPNDRLAMLWSLPVWQACREANAVVDHALALVEGSSARDADAMRKAGEAWFALREGNAHPEAKPLDATALLTMLVAAASQEDWVAMCALDARLGQHAKPPGDGPDPRGLLRALALGEMSAAAKAAGAASGCVD